MSDSIDIQITVSDKAPEKPSFGIPLIADFHTAWGDRVREYGDTSELLDDGFTTSSAVYQMAQVIKSQQPTLPKFKVGRLEAATYTHTFTLTPKKTTPGLIYSGAIAGTDFEVEVQPGDAIADIVDDLVADLTPITPIAVTDSSTHVTVAADNPATIISIANLSEHLWVEDTTTVNGANLQADLSEINDEDPEWYGLVLAINSAQAIAAAATWTEANGKIFVPMSSDGEILDAGVTDDIASALVGQAWTRTCGIWHRSLGGAEWANAAFLTANLSPDPGTYTGSFKTLTGISADKLRKGAQSALLAKRFTRYMREHGINVTKGGRTPSGRFFDVVRFTDWLKAEIEAEVFSLLFNNPKVPYTNAGISAVKGAVETCLIRGRNAGGIADDSPLTVTAPNISETAQIDRTNRTLRDVKFSCRLSSALENIIINGTVSV